MDKAQTDRMSEAPAAPQEERAARHLRMLARAAEIHMEIMEATRTEAVAALCRRWGYPVQVKQWLEMADEALEHYGFIPPQDGEDDEDPPEPRPAGTGRRKPKPPDTG